MSQPDPLDLIRRQIVDLQERTTALEKTPPSQRPDGALEGLLAAGLKAVAGTVRTAAEAKAARTAEPADAPEPAPTRPAVRDAVQRAADSVARAQAAAAPLFPITEPEPAAPFAGRTAPRRTLPPEAPVRLWNREHTDHLDVIGRAASGGLDGVQRIRIRDDHADGVRQWLRDRITDDEHVFAAWADRPWSFVGYGSGGGSGPLSLDLLPLPKPPRVDEVLGRPGGFDPGPTPAEHPGYTVADLTAMKDRITKGYAESRGLDKARCPGCTNPAEHGHYPWCPQAHPLSEALEREPAGTVTSGRIHVERAGADAPECTCLVDDDGYHARDCHITLTAVRRPAPDVDEVLPMPGGPNDRLSQAVRTHTPAGRLADAPKPSGYGDLYARLDDIHDATAEEDQ